MNETGDNFHCTIQLLYFTVCCVRHHVKIIQSNRCTDAPYGTVPYVYDNFNAFTIHVCMPTVCIDPYCRSKKLN